MHACFRAAKMIDAAASVYKSTIGIPYFLVSTMAMVAMARAAAGANRIPVNVFRCDRPEIDQRRVRVWRRKRQEVMR